MQGSGELGSSVSELLLAAAAGRLPDVRELVLNCDALDAVNGCNAALACAAAEGHLAVCRFLLAVGADMCALDSSGSSVLCQAVRGGHPDVVELLLEAGASVNAGCDEQCPLLLEACESPFAQSEQQQEKLIFHLLTFKADPDVIRESDGLGAIHAAALSGQPELVRILLQAGASVNLQTVHRKTPLMLAVEAGHDLVVQLLCSHNAFQTCRDTISIPAAPPPLQLLPQNEVDPEQFSLLTLPPPPTEDGAADASLLVTAIKNGHIPVALELLHHGADPNLPIGLEAPLKLALDRGHDKLVEGLLLAGADASDLLLELGRDIWGSAKRRQIRDRAIQKLETLIDNGIDTELIFRFDKGIPFTLCDLAKYHMGNSTATVELLEILDAVKSAPVCLARQRLAWAQVCHSFLWPCSFGDLVEPSVVESIGSQVVFAYCADRSRSSVAVARRHSTQEAVNEILDSIINKASFQVWLGLSSRSDTQLGTDPRPTG